MKVENRIMKNKTRNIIWTVAGVLLLVGLVYASTITDTYTTNGNITNNNTGIYYNNQKTFARTADVVVCSATALTYAYKFFTCDVVCLEGTDCSSNLNTTLSNGNINLKIMKGDYLINSSIRLKDNTTIYGAGVDLTTLKMGCGFPVDATGYRFLIMTGATEATAGNNNALSLSDITLDGQKECNTASNETYNLIHSFADNNFRITNVRFTKSGGTGLDCDNTPCLITNSQADNNTLDGYYLNHARSDGHVSFAISQSKASNNGRDGIHSPQKGGTILSNYVWSNGRYGIHLAATNAETTDGSYKIVALNEIHDNTNYPIYLEGQANYRVLNSVISSNVIYNTATTHSIYEAVNVTNVSYTGNILDKPIQIIQSTPVAINNLGNNISYLREGLNIQAKGATTALSITQGNTGRGIILQNSGSNTYTDSNAFVTFSLGNGGDSGNLLRLNHDGTGMPLLIDANATQTNCTGSVPGAIYYDGTTNKHYGCNGSSWNALY